MVGTRVCCIIVFFSKASPPNLRHIKPLCVLQHLDCWETGPCCIATQKASFNVSNFGSVANLNFKYCCNSSWFCVALCKMLSCVTSMCCSLTFGNQILFTSFEAFIIQGGPKVSLQQSQSKILLISFYVLSSTFQRTLRNKLSTIKKILKPFRAITAFLLMAHPVYPHTKKSKAQWWWSMKLIFDFLRSKNTKFCHNAHYHSKL